MAIPRRRWRCDAVLHAALDYREAHAVAAEARTKLDQVPTDTVARNVYPKGGSAGQPCMFGVLKSAACR